MAFRGGFNGGSRNTGGMMGGQKLPFDIDAGLDDEIAKYRDEDPKKEALAKDPKELYPPYPGGVPRAPPVTAREKQMVRRYREYIAQRHAGPLYTGPPGTVAKMQTGSKRSAAEFNAFEDQETYGKKFQKTEWKWPDLTKHKFAQSHLFPKDLWTTIGYNPAADPAQANRRKKLTLARPSIVDKLARFDDDAAAAADHDDVEEEEEAVGAGEDEDGEAADELQDDDFEEDEDDGNDDYNAEQYFDGGDDDFEEGGGGVEEYGGGGGDDGF